MREDTGARILVRPRLAVPGARIDIEWARVPFDGTGLPEVRIGEAEARVVFAAPYRLGVVVPETVEAGCLTVRIGGSDASGTLRVGRVLASGVHQVDSPVFDRAGNLFVTDSGPRGERVPVSIFRVRPNGTREPFVSGIVNPTSMAFDAQGDLYVSSRFEGAVYRVKPDGTYAMFAGDLGVACGLAFGPDGALYVGDRSGTIFHVNRPGRTRAFAELPSSVAAFHLAFGPDGWLYVTAPTLNSCDHVYRIDAAGTIETFCSGFGRPQGLAFDARGSLHVSEALAGWSGVFRLTAGQPPEQVVGGSGLVGLTFDARGGLVVASNETVWCFDADEPGGPGSRILN